MRTCLSDLRSPRSWSKADRERKCESALVSILWDRNPFGTRDVLAMPNVQPGIWTSGGFPVGPAGSFNVELAAVLARIPGAFLIDGLEANIWAAGDDKVQAFDVSRLDVVEVWTDMIIRHFAPIFRAIQHDYLTSLRDLGAPHASDEYWQRWSAGYVAAISRLHGSFDHIQGQVHHVTRLSHYADAIYYEVHPQAFGITIEQHRMRMMEHPGWRDAVWEVRDPNTPPGATSMAAWKTYLDEVVDFVDGHGMVLSWGRDASALVGLP
jgi:hypothetical protein